MYSRNRVGGFDDIFEKLPQASNGPTNTTSSSTVRTLYKCIICAKVVTNKWHHTQYHYPQQFQCNNCDHIVTRKDHLKKHLKSCSLRN